MAVKLELNQPTEFYSHYCLSCCVNYFAAARLEPCPICSGKNVVNCFGESYEVEYGVETSN